MVIDWLRKMCGERKIEIVCMMVAILPHLVRRVTNELQCYCTISAATGGPAGSVAGLNHKVNTAMLQQWGTGRLLDYFWETHLLVQQYPLSPPSLRCPPPVLAPLAPPKAARRNTEPRGPQNRAFGPTGLREKRRRKTEWPMTNAGK